MKKILATVCGAAMISLATLSQAQDSTSTDYNNQNTVEQQSQDQSQPHTRSIHARPARAGSAGSRMETMQFAKVSHLNQASQLRIKSIRPWKGQMKWSR